MPIMPVNKDKALWQKGSRRFSIVLEAGYNPGEQVQREDF